MKCILVFVAIAVSCLASVPLAAQTEVPRVARLGMLSDLERFGNPISPSDWLASFRAGLRDSGYEEGKNIRFEFRNGDRDPEKLAKMAAELTAMKVDVIVASSTTAAKAAKATTHAIPIVFWGAEPISSGLVASLDRPGENLTGVTANEEQQAQFLAMLKEVVPDLKRVAILFNRSYAPVPGLLKNAESGARALGLSTQLVEVAAPSDLPGAFEAMKREGSRAVLVLNHGMFFRERAKLATLAIENGIAVSTPYLPNAEAGALIAHEPDFDQVWRLNASYVDKILKGANPGDLPVQRLAAFRYSINLKTAKALGLTIPQSVLNRAALVAVCAVVLPPQVNRVSVEDEVVKEIKQLEGERSRNLVNGDAEKQDQLLAPEFVEVSATGQVRTKAENIQGMKSGQTHWEAFDLSDLDVHVYGETAVVTGRLRRKGTSAGRDISGQSRYTRYYVRRQGHWQAIFQHGIPIRDADNASASGQTRTTTDDEAAIRKIVAEGTDAWNRRDAKAQIIHFSEDIDHIGVQGLWRSSRAELEKSFTAGSPTVRNDQSTTVERIRFLTPDVAVAVVRRRYVGEFRDSPGHKETREAISTSVFHKIDGLWWIEAFQNTLVQSREEAVAQAARASGPMAQTEPEVITPANSKIDFSGDAAAIRKMVADSVDAWNRRDPKAETAHGSENHDHINVIGEWRQGKVETEKAMTAALATTRNNIGRSIAKIRFITPAIAVVITRNEYTNDKETLKAISTSVLHKINGEWWNEAFQNTYVQPAADQPSEKKPSDNSLGHQDRNARGATR